MRKKLFFVAVIFCMGLANVSQAQSFLRFGLKLNPIFAWAGATDEDKKSISGIDKGSRLGFSGGLMVDYVISDIVAVHSGLHIVRKGFKNEFTMKANVTATGTEGETTEEVSQEFKFAQKAGITTVEIPLAVKLRTGDFIMPDFRLRFLFGGALGLNVGAKTKYSVPNAVDEESRKLGDFYQPLSVDFLIGAGAEYEIEGIGTFDAGFSYHNGLLRLDKKKKDGIPSRLLAHYFSIDLGYFF